MKAETYVGKTVKGEHDFMEIKSYNPEYDEYTVDVYRNWDHTLSVRDHVSDGEYVRSLPVWRNR